MTGGLQVDATTEKETGVSAHPSLSQTSSVVERLDCAADVLASAEEEEKALELILNNNISTNAYRHTIINHNNSD